MKVLQQLAEELRTEYMEGNSGQNDDYGCSSSVGVPAPLVLDMFQGVTYKYFSLNNNVTDIVFPHTNS